MKIKCEYCGKELEVKPASLMGMIKTIKKSNASRINGLKGGRPVTKLNKSKEL